MKRLMVCVVSLSLWIPCVIQAGDIRLWPEIEPYSSDFLEVSDIHTLYCEQCGNRAGKPVFVLHGGPGAARLEGMLFLGWAYGSLQLLFFALCFALGLRRAGGLGRLRLPLIAGAVLHQLCWLLLLASYASYSADPAPQTTALGFPPPTAVMLYVLWPFPIWFVALYVLCFDRLIFTVRDQRRFDELVARFGIEKPGDDT